MPEGFTDVVNGRKFFSISGIGMADAELKQQKP